jgi:hypothetical protein
MSNQTGVICTTCIKKSVFRLVTENYKPIITQDTLYYIGDSTTIYTLVKINPPKPTWTNSYGIEVLLKDAVLIGGNGLNG